MSAYDNDDRVEEIRPGTFDIELPGTPGVAGSQDGRVQAAPGGGFEAFVWTDNPVKRVFGTADEAICSLIGDPQ